MCKILEMTGARIILSSDWRKGGIKRMKGFLAIYKLDSYLDDATYHILDEQRYNPEYSQTTEAWNNIQRILYKRFNELCPADPNKWFDGVDYRVVEIREYLDRHPEITSFVALDDRNLTKELDGLLYIPKIIFRKKMCNYALRFLTGKTDLFFWMKACIYQN